MGLERCGLSHRLGVERNLGKHLPLTEISFGLAIHILRRQIALPNAGHTSSYREPG